MNFTLTEGLTTRTLSNRSYGQSYSKNPKGIFTLQASGKTPHPENWKIQETKIHPPAFDYTLGNCRRDSKIPVNEMIG